MDNTVNKGLSFRRLRQNPAIRELTKEIYVLGEHLIQPCFVVDGINHREPVPGMNGVFRESSDSILQQIETDVEAGVRKFLLFGVPSKKSTRNLDFSFTAKQISEIKRRFGKDLFLAVDVCLCSSTEHGQCGVLNDTGDHVENAETVDELSRAALQYAQAGADCIAPSDMMDGRVGAIRASLDKAGLEQTIIMSYSAKFNSRFYGPFRLAADSAPKGNVILKDRATYQIDPARPTDALVSSIRDSDEGADILMVKPGLPYLDILAKLSKEIPRPWAVYEVSGEYAAIELLAEKGLINQAAGHVEAWTSFMRAGASIIITYGARYAREWLKQVNQ